MTDFEPCELVDINGRVFHCCVEEDRGRVLLLRSRDDQLPPHRRWAYEYDTETGELGEPDPLNPVGKANNKPFFLIREQRQTRLL